MSDAPDAIGRDPAGAMCTEGRGRTTRASEAFWVYTNRGKGQSIATRKIHALCNTAAPSSLGGASTHPIANVWGTPRSTEGSLALFVPRWVGLWVSCSA